MLVRTSGLNWILLYINDLGWIADLLFQLSGIRKWLFQFGVLKWNSGEVIPV
jgi:hypothetical protein